MTLLQNMQDPNFHQACLQNLRAKDQNSPGRAASFETFLHDPNIVKDLECLAQGTYVLSPPTVSAQLSRGKRRAFFEYPDKDKNLLRLLRFALLEYERPRASHVVSSPVGPGLRQAVRSLTSCIPQENRYVLRGDIKRYSDSFDQEVLTQIVQRVLPDDEPLAQRLLLDALIPQSYLTNGVLVHEPIIAGTGCPVDAFVHCVYLMDLDEYLSGTADAYMRFGDDFCAVFDSRERCELALNEATAILNNLKLELNVDKVRIVEPLQPFDYIGLRLRGDTVDLATSIVTNMKKQLRHQARLLLNYRRRGRIDGAQAMELFSAGVYDYLFCGQVVGQFAAYVCTLNTSEGIDRIDRCFRDCMRMLGSGTAGPARYRIGYDELHAHGYQSLVHLFYHRELWKVS